MRIEHHDITDFLQEIREDSKRVVDGIVRIQKCEESNDDETYVELLLRLTALMQYPDSDGQYLVECRYYCGNETAHDTAARMKYEDALSATKDVCGSAGLRIRPGAIERF